MAGRGARWDAFAHDVLAGFRRVVLGSAPELVLRRLARRRAIERRVAQAAAD